MADIRINALATTAASTASDDFVAVDGSANGTRKLNAFSPTFGGNLTVSGTGTSSVAGVFKAGTDIVTGDTSAFQVHNNVDDKPMVGFYRGGTLRSVLRLNTDNDFRLLSSDLSTPANLTAGNLTVSGGTIGTAASTNLTLAGGSSGASLALGQGTTGTFTFTLPSISAGSTTWVSAGATGIGIDFKRATATATVGGTLASLNGYNGATRSTIFEFNGDGATDSGRFDWWVKPTAGSLTQAMVLKSNGNLLIGTTTDGGQKLQVSGNSGFLGHLEIPADKHIYMKQGNPLRWSSDGLSTGTVRADIYADSGGILYFRTNGTTAALNIDNFQTARFAGAIAINNTVQTAVGVASTHKVTISIGGSTYYLLATNV